MKLKHTAPCKKCPWRKDSAAGWLGNSTPKEFVLTTLGESHMPCHCAVDYEDPDWRDKLNDIPLCSGALAFMKNTCKVPRDSELRDAMSLITDHDKVFSNPLEFIEYHGGTL